MNSSLDHILLGCRDLDEGIAYIEKLSGCRAALGGSHPGQGTRNALLRIGRESYLEILAPDPEQETLAWHPEITELTLPTLIGWAMKASHLDHRAASLRKKGVRVIGPLAGSRTAPGGDVLRWTTLRFADDLEGILPFYIDWDPASTHPASTAPGGCPLREFHYPGESCEQRLPEAEHPVPVPPPRHLSVVRLSAKLAGQRGEFLLTSRALPPDYRLPLTLLPL